MNGKSPVDNRSGSFRRALPVVRRVAVRTASGHQLMSFIFRCHPLWAVEVRYGYQFTRGRLQISDRVLLERPTGVCKAEVLSCSS